MKSNVHSLKMSSAIGLVFFKQMDDLSQCCSDTPTSFGVFFSSLDLYIYFSLNLRPPSCIQMPLYSRGQKLVKSGSAGIPRLG